MSNCQNCDINFITSAKDFAKKVNQWNKEVVGRDGNIYYYDGILQDTVPFGIRLKHIFTSQIKMGWDKD